MGDSKTMALALIAIIFLGVAQVLTSMKVRRIQRVVEAQTEVLTAMDEFLKETRYEPMQRMWKKDPLRPN